MAVFGIDIDQIADLGTQVASAGAIRVAEIVGDEIFDYVVGVAIIVYELDPR